MRDWINLFEAMPLSMAKKYSAIKARFKHDDVFGGKDRIVLKIDMPTDRPHAGEFSIAKEIISRLRDKSYLSMVPDDKLAKITNDGQLGILTRDQEDDYIAGLVMFRGKKVRIGKLLSAHINFWESVDPERYPSQLRHDDRILFIKSVITELREFQKAYETDPVRSGAKLDKARFEIIISRHPYDIAGASTDRGWTSCIDTDGGSDRKYLDSYIERGAVIAYLVRADDRNISRPLARIIIENLEDSAGNSIFVAMQQYGFQFENFEETIKRWCAKQNRNKPNGIYHSTMDAQYPQAVEKIGEIYRTMSWREYYTHTSAGDK